MEPAISTTISSVMRSCKSRSGVIPLAEVSKRLGQHSLNAWKQKFRSPPVRFIEEHDILKSHRVFAKDAK